MLIAESIHKIRTGVVRHAGEIPEAVLHSVAVLDAVRKAVKFDLTQCQNLFPKDPLNRGMQSDNWQLGHMHFPFQECYFEILPEFLVFGAAEPEPLGVLYSESLGITGGRHKTLTCLAYDTHLKILAPLNAGCYITHSGTLKTFMPSEDRKSAFYRPRVEAQILASLYCLEVALDYLDSEPTHIRANKVNEYSNGKRARKGKKSIFSSYVVDINKIRYEPVSTGAGGHASPKKHRRRGHIRHLPDKKVWVRPCTVGQGGFDMLTKDYRVKPSNHENTK